MPRQFSYVVQRADLWPLLCRPNDDFTIRAPMAGTREIISIVLKIKRVSSIAGGSRGNSERGTKKWMILGRASIGCIGENIFYATV